MQESPHEREGIDSANRLPFRFLTGLVGLAALIYVVVEVFDMFRDRILDHGVEALAPLMWLLVVTAPTGWGGLVYACWFRSGRITDTALAFVWAVGTCGMAISYLALGLPFVWGGTMFLTGTWILNGLGIVWLVHRLRRIRAASNTDAADAAR